MRLSHLLAGGLATPFFVYSEAQLRADWQAYAQAVAGHRAIVAYAVKANHNPVLMQRLHALGAAATVVSADELHHARQLGFGAPRLLLHGSGKRTRDLDAALLAEALVSVDSEFDLEHLAQRATALGRAARVLLRVNPNIDPKVHPYICTGLDDSKFGMSEARVEALRPRLGQLPQLAVSGLHCHLGSTLRSAAPVRDAARLLLPLLARLRSDGHPIDTLDLGGGLGIDYHHGTAPPEPPLPTPGELLAPLWPLVDELGVQLWLEPGRSLVGRCGALIGRVIGLKRTPSKRFLVVDASMAQLIRPCLYQAYHHIELLEPAAAPAAESDDEPCDIVGPICESADFLGLSRRLGTPREGDGVIIYDAGAYGFAMASRYNLQLLCAEYLVAGTEVRCIRRAETYDDFARTFTDHEVSLP